MVFARAGLDVELMTRSGNQERVLDPAPVSMQRSPKEPIRVSACQGGGGAGALVTLLGRETRGAKLT
jgi:hypothetical protein